MRIMSLGTNCLDLIFLPEEWRVRGPLDNVSIWKSTWWERIWNGSFLRHLYNRETEWTCWIKEPQAIVNERDSRVAWCFDGLVFGHTEINERKYKIELSRRTGVLQEFMHNLAKTQSKEMWLTMSFRSDFNTEKDLPEAIQWLKEKNLFNRTIFVQTKTEHIDHSVGRDELWNFNMPEEKLKQLGIEDRTILLEDGSWNIDKEKTRAQFAEKFLKLIENIV